MHLRLSDLREAQATGEAWVLVTIVETRGSTPREVGASMLVFAQHTHGTIGGGELEFQATATARELLREGESSSEQHYVLGARLGQCCGGQANLWFESSDAWQTALPGLDNNKTYVTVTRQQEATRRFLEVKELTSKKEKSSVSKPVRKAEPKRKSAFSRGFNKHFNKKASLD